MACTPCGTGTYQPSAGQQACFNCTSGTVSDLSSSSLLYPSSLMHHIYYQVNSDRTKCGNFRSSSCSWFYKESGSDCSPDPAKFAIVIGPIVGAIIAILVVIIGVVLVVRRNRYKDYKSLPITTNSEKPSKIATTRSTQRNSIALNS